MDHLLTVDNTLWLKGTAFRGSVCWSTLPRLSLRFSFRGRTKILTRLPATAPLSTASHIADTSDRGRWASSASTRASEAGRRGASGRRDQAQALLTMLPPHQPAIKFGDDVEADRLHGPGDPRLEKAKGWEVNCRPEYGGAVYVGHRAATHRGRLASESPERKARTIWTFALRCRSNSGPGTVTRIDRVTVANRTHTTAEVICVHGQY
jgi:hypothetical protein